MNARFSLAGAGLALALLSSAAQAQELPASQYYGATEYISGGIGSDESQLFRLARKNYPLSVSFSANLGEDRMGFVSDVQLVIRNSNDQTVLNSLIDGPYCLIRLQPGAYKVFATYQGVTQERSAEVADGQPREINFMWK